MDNKVSFECLIKQVTIKSLVSADKQARMILEFVAEDDELISAINKLHRADETVVVVIMDKKQNTLK